jgi:hypothetical protein
MRACAVRISKPFNLVKTIPAAQAYVDPKESGCSLVK